MKIKMFILVCIVFRGIAFGQISLTEKKLDSLHFATKHEESIQLRKAFISNLNDKNDIKRNQLKLKLSEYHSTNSWKEGLALLESIKSQVLDTNLVSDDFKVEFYSNYYHAVAFANQDWERSLLIAKEFLAKIKKKQLKATLINETEVVYDIAYIHGELNQPYEAINYYDQAAILYRKQNLERTSDMALLYNNLGHEYSKLSNYKECNDRYVLATEIWEQEPEKNSNNLTTAYNNLIYNYIPYGEIKKAEFYLNKLKTISIKLDKTNLENYQKVQLSILLNELKINEFKNDPKCMVTYNQLINYYHSLKNPKLYIDYYASAQNTTIDYLNKNKLYEDAEKLALTTENYLKKQKYNDRLLVLYSRFVVIKKEQKKLQEALSYVNQAIAISDKTIKGNQAGLLVSKGVVLKEMNNLKEAEFYYTEAQNILDEEQSANIETISYYTEIANFYIKKYEKQPNKNDLNKAFALFENCINQFNNIYKNGVFNPRLDEYLDLIHEGLLTIAYQDASKQVQVLDYLENTSSKYLWSNFIRNSSSNNLLDLDNNYSKLQKIKEEIGYYKTEIQKEKEKKIPNETKLKDFNFKVFELLSKTEQLELKLSQSNVNYKNLYEPKYKTSEFISTLSNVETIINFYPTKDNIYAIVLNNSGIQKIKRIENKEKLYTQILNYRETILNKDDFSKLNTQLYNSLFDDLPLASKQLTIITRDALSLLPFETLQANNRFLIEKFAIHYSSSFTLYALQKALSTENNFKLAVFNPDYKNTNFSNLPFAKQEATFLKKQFAATLFSDSLANKQNFIENIKNYNIYHLAMHAQVNNEDENASKLIFTSENLYFSDLFAQELPLDLVVLSACETGFGKNLEGEGILSLSRAFTYSGVASTVHSLWQTPDKQGAEIMQYFYEFLSEGLTKNEALQQAKLKFIETAKAEELKHPYFWAGFVLCGNPDAITSNHYGIYILVGLGSLILLTVLFFKFRK